MLKKLNAKGFSHHLLLFIIPLVAVAAIGAYVINSSRASGGFVCTIGPVFTDGTGTTDGGVMSDGQQWYSVVLQNRTGTATSTLNDIAFVGKSSSGSTFTWNAQTYDGKYIDWLKGFSGVKILNNGTVQGQVRKPTTPAGVGQANWSVIVKGVTYSCNTTTNINTTYTSLVNSVNSTTTTPTTPAPAPATPPPTTTAPAPATPVAAVYNGTFGCVIGNLSSTTGTWYSVKITNSTDNSTATLDELNMVGTKPDNSTVILNGKTNASSFKWVKGFSGTKILVRTTAEFNINGTGVAQDKWKFRISGKDYTCAKEAPQASSTTMAGISCEAAFDTAIILGQPIKTTATFTPLESTGIASGAYRYEIWANQDGASKAVLANSVPAFTTSAGKPSVTVNSLVPAYQQKNGSKVTLSYMIVRNSDGKSVSNCVKGQKGYVTYDLSNGKLVATAATDVPAAPMVPNGGATPATGTTPGGSGSSNAKPKIADLGYGDNLNLQCISRKGTGKTAVFTAVPCAQANTLILTVSGVDNAAMPRNKLSYGVDVSRNTTDHFGTVSGCAPRTVIVGTKKVTYDCTIVYYNQSFFQSTAKTISNFFKSIVAKAKADTYLSKSEAKADIAKLRAGDLRIAKTKIVLSHAGYVSQIVNGENMILDYNEASSVSQIINIAKKDCENKGGTFNTTTYGCTTQSNGSGGSGGSVFDGATGGNSSAGTGVGGSASGLSSSPNSCGTGYHWTTTSSGAPRCVADGNYVSKTEKCSNAGGTWKANTCYKCPSPFEFVQASSQDTSSRVIADGIGYSCKAMSSSGRGAQYMTPQTVSL